jgi:hypothetical protein
MTLAIMQPYLFPYIGYWQLINAVDTFVIYDNIQFSKKGWFNRNNILLNGKKTLFSIPLKKDSDSLDVVERYISDGAEKEINKIIRQVENAYKKAPYFVDVFPLIKEIFQNAERNLFKYIYNSIIQICEYLEINTNIVISSTINIDHSLKSQDKVIAINKELNATKYINPIGGIGLYDFEEFNKENIELSFLESEVPEYKQFSSDFIPYLSIIDIMMFNSKKDVKQMLKRYELV